MMTIDKMRGCVSNLFFYPRLHIKKIKNKEKQVDYVMMKLT